MTTIRNYGDIWQCALKRGSALVTYGLMVVLLTTLPAPAQNLMWEQTNGPFGGEILALLATQTTTPHGGPAGTLYAGIEVGGVARSDDGGNTWIPKNNGLTIPNSRLISSLAISDSYLFAASYNVGVFRSSDGGNSWTQTGLTIGVGSLLVVGPSIYAGTGYASNGSGVYRSDDNGVNWVQKNNGLPPLAEVRALAAIGTSIYAAIITDDGKRGEGIFRSDDGGNNWVAKNTGLGNLLVNSIAVSGTSLYVATNGGIYRSDDGGDTWTAKNNGLPSNFSHRGQVVFATGTRLYAGVANNGVFRSDDGGNSWTPKNNGLFPIALFNAFAATSTSLYVGSGAGIFRSDDNGESWTRKNNGLKYTQVRDLLLVGSTLYAATVQGVFQSTDMGNFWMESSTGLATPHVNSLAVLGTDLYAGTQAGGNFGMGVYRSTDGGNSWTPAGTLGEIVYTLAVHGGILYAGTHSGGVFRFDGETWIPKSNGLPTPVYALLASGTRLYAGTSNGAFYSEDGGDSWVPINLTGKSVISLFAFGGCLYAGTDSMGTYRSCDEGTTWIPIINPPSNVRAFAAFGASLFAIRGGDVPTGVFRSDDGGDTWVPVNSGLEAYLATRSPTILYSLEVVGNELYLGTYSGGVFRASLMDVLMDVTSMSQLNTFGMRFNRRTGQLSMMATWKNMGADPFYPPLQMVIESITPPSVTVANPDGTTPAGKPYFDFSALIGSDGKLSPGETSGAKQLIFNNPTRVRFNFTVSFWAQVGSGGFPAPPLKVLIEPPPPSDVEIPLVSALAQNFPNPFNPETWIPYALAKASPVQIIIYDIQGRLVRTLDLGHREVGQYLNREKAAYWDGRNQLGEPVGSGVYLYRLQAGEFQATRKMVILK